MITKHFFLHNFTKLIYIGVHCSCLLNDSTITIVTYIKKKRERGRERRGQKEEKKENKKGKGLGKEGTLKIT